MFGLHGRYWSRGTELGVAVLVWTCWRVVDLNPERCLLHVFMVSMPRTRRKFGVECLERLQLSSYLIDYEIDYCNNIKDVNFACRAQHDHNL